MEFKAGRAGRFTKSEQEEMIKAATTIAKWYGVTKTDVKFTGAGELRLHNNTAARHTFLNGFKGMSKAKFNRRNQRLLQLLAVVHGWKMTRYATAMKVGAGAARKGWGNYTRPATAVKVTPKKRTRKATAKVS